VKSKVAFHPLVEVDAANAAEWYERQQAGLGVAFVAEYRDHLRHLPDEALFCAVRFHGIRRVNLPRFPYGIFYSLVDGGVVVLGVLHGARDSEAELARRRKFF
jgi:toxin ParE1/3/4